MAKDISNSDDIIDSRDVIERIDELQSERDDLQSAIDNARETLADVTDDTSALKDMAEAIEAREALTDAQAALAVWDADNGDELAALKALQSDAEGYAADWNHGEALVRDSYFTEYAQQLADDIGAIGANARWPLNHIDWDGAADELKQDYTAVEFDGVTYWVREG